MYIYAYMYMYVYIYIYTYIHIKGKDIFKKKHTLRKPSDSQYRQFIHKNFEAVNN